MHPAENPSYPIVVDGAATQSFRTKLGTRQLSQRDWPARKGEQQIEAHIISAAGAAAAERPFHALSSGLTTSWTSN